MRSARSITNPMSCSTSSTDMPPARNWRSRPASCCFSMCRKPAAGSSSSSSIGSTHNARAISTMRCWPSDRLPGQHVDLVGEADALDLACRFRQQFRLVRAVEAKHAGDGAGLAAQMRADRDIFQHAHVRHQFDMLEGAGDAEPGHLLRRRVIDFPAEHRDRAARRSQHAGDQVEGRALAGAVRADQRHDLAGPDVEGNVVDRDHAAELLARMVDLQQHGGRVRLLWPRAGKVREVSGRLRSGLNGKRAVSQGQTPVGASCSSTTSRMPNTMVSSWPSP